MSDSRVTAYGRSLPATVSPALGSFTDEHGQIAWRRWSMSWRFAALAIVPRGPPPATFTLMPPLDEDLRVVLGLDTCATTQLIAPRLIVRASAIADRSGGALAIGLLIFADSRLASAPIDVRQAVLAHELGHIRLGHTAAMSAAFLAAVLYAASTLVNPPTALWVTVNCTLLAVVAASALWATRPAREFEADQYAAGIVGKPAVARALRWSMGPDTPSPLATLRLAVLEAPSRQ